MARSLQLPYDTPASQFETLRSVARDQFLAAMGRVFSLVTIVATDGPAGRLAVTVSAASSACADPPMMLACINRRSPVNGAIHTNGVFSINVLAVGQEQLSDRFAGRVHDGGSFDFARADWATAQTGSPMLHGAVAAFDCVLQSSHGAGSHTVFFGRVLTVIEGEAMPLIYGRRSYGSPRMLDNARQTLIPTK
jgi:flavin reductase (DIM6/NTAB) family NADH-FMN oxidoreductase RutF